MKKKKLRWAFIILLLAVLVFSGYQVIRVILDYQQSQNIYDDLRAQYRTETQDPSATLTPTVPPTTQPTPTPQPVDEEPTPTPSPPPYVMPDHFHDLIEINSDFV